MGANPFEVQPESQAAYNEALANRLARVPLAFVLEETADSFIEALELAEPREAAYKRNLESLAALEEEGDNNQLSVEDLSQINFDRPNKSSLSREAGRIPATSIWVTLGGIEDSITGLALTVLVTMLFHAAVPITAPIPLVIVLKRNLKVLDEDELEVLRTFDRLATEKGGTPHKTRLKTEELLPRLPYESQPEAKQKLDEMRERKILLNVGNEWYVAR